MRFGLTIMEISCPRLPVGLTNLPRTYHREDIESVCARFLEAQCFSYRSIRHALERRAAALPDPEPARTQTGPAIRALGEYQAFWEVHARTHSVEN